MSDPIVISETSNTWDQLMAAKAVTETTGVVSDAQVLQLQYWGPMCIPHAEEVEFEFTLPWTEHEKKVDGSGDDKFYDERVVEFRAKATSAAPKDFKKRLKLLDIAVKRLLGERFTVRTKIDGEVIFESKGTSKSPWATKTQPTGKRVSRRRSKRSRLRK
jgi:hypothetical protein